MNTNRIIEKFTAFSLIGAGLVAVIVSIGDIFLDYSQTPYLKEAPSIAVPLVVGFLCFALGLERLNSFENMKETLNTIKIGVENFGSVKFSTNYKKQFEAIEQIIDATSNSLYILTFDLGKVRDKNTKAYKLYVDRVIDSIRKHPNLEYKVVLGINTPKPSETVLKVLRSRKKDFSDAGVENRAHLAYRQLPVGLTILISDETVVIGFSRVSGDPAPRNMVVLNKEELASYIGAWYNRYIWKESVEV